MAAIEMPPYIATRKFDLVYVQQLSPTGEYGFIQTLDRTAPFWLAEYTTGPLPEDRYRAWINFLDLLEGSRNTFLGYDPRRPMPYMYRTQLTTFDPWTQTGQVAPQITAFSYANSTITLGRLQNGATIYYGDYISASIGGIWYLFRSQEYVPSVTGNSVVLDVKPRPNIANFVATNIRYRMACAEMKVIGRVQEDDSGPGDFPSFAFRAGQYTARVPA